MKTIRAVAYKQRLDVLFKRVSSSPDDLDRAHWARYLCVLVSGFIETSLGAIYSDYARKRAAPDVAAYVCARLAKLTNMKMADVCGLAGEFNRSWRCHLEQATAGEIKDAVDSVVANRNLIAHGRDVGISYHRVKDYYGSVVTMVELVESTVLGES